MAFPYRYDEVLEAICSTRAAGAHLALTNYLLAHEKEVGLHRFRRLLENGKLRGVDALNIHFAMARIDPLYAAELPGLLRSTKSPDTQQGLLVALPDLIARERREVVADELEAWLRRRIEKISYLENGASWEVPGVLLAILRSSDVARARSLLADIEADLFESERARARAALGKDDKEFESDLKAWHGLDIHYGRDRTPDEVAETDAETEREAAKYMRRLGFRPIT